MPSEMDMGYTDLSLQAMYTSMPVSEVQWDCPDNISIATADCNEEEVEIEIECFEVYRTKIEKLLIDIGYPDCEILALQHGLNWSNCVYALTSRANENDKYILRVPMHPDLREDDGICEAVLNNAVTLGYLADKLPVPRVLAYSATGENALEAPYMLQSQLAGISLNQVYEDLDTEEKFAIIDQYIGLISRLEAITFSTAGTFTASVFEPVSTNRFAPLADPDITIFDSGDKDFIGKPENVADRAGSDVRSLLVSHVDGWLEDERKYEEQYHTDTGKVPYYRKLREILAAMDSEIQPIVLHHWDLEARNVMVTWAPEGYKITGVIDWDEALAYPRNLARRAPDWIWDFAYEEPTDYKNSDFHPHLDLSDEALELKAYFDEKAKSVLGEQYLEDAYGTGRFLRRIWSLVKLSMHNPSDLNLMIELCEEHATSNMEYIELESDEELEPGNPVLSARQQSVDLGMTPNTLLVTEEPLPLPVELEHPEQPDGLWARMVSWLRSCMI
ncbi:MAG: hypothetical protein L6R41_008416 [Letrouitia leprolyta]|nr:MAG: hypothetical protein L6R41_008416 [Letrouitia leprolyta]